jgi:hypothetical protein
MKINETILLELEQNINNYFVITQEISKKINSIDELNKSLLENRLQNKVDKKLLGELKRDSFYYQFYNVMLVKIISNVKLLYKLIKLHEIESDNFNEEVVKNIIDSDPETMAIDNGEIIIIDENLKDIFENKLLDISDEEFKQLVGSQKSSEKVKLKNEKGK